MLTDIDVNIGKLTYKSFCYPFFVLQNLSAPLFYPMTRTYRVILARFYPINTFCQVKCLSELIPNMRIAQEAAPNALQVQICFGRFGSTSATRCRSVYSAVPPQTELHEKPL